VLSGALPGISNFDNRVEGFGATCISRLVVRDEQPEFFGPRRHLLPSFRQLCERGLDGHGTIQFQDPRYLGRSLLHLIDRKLNSGGVRLQFSSIQLTSGSIETPRSDNSFANGFGGRLDPLELGTKAVPIGAFGLPFAVE